MTIDREKLKAFAERLVSECPGGNGDPVPAIGVPAADALALLAEIERLTEEVALDDKIIAERDRLLAAIPECKPHGQCVPHAIEWVESMKAENEALRKDAERYAWLRLGMGKAIVVQPDNTSTCDCGRLQVLLEQEVDEAADAGLAEVNGHG